MPDPQDLQAGRSFHELLERAKNCARSGRFSEAGMLYQQCLSQNPKSALVLGDLGSCFFECGNYQEAIACYREALALNPEDHKVHAQLGIVLLLTAPDRVAWDHFEHRKLIVPSPMQTPPPVPAWNGEPLNGRGIVMLREQGIGDELHAIRHVPDIAARGGKVWLNVHPALRPLLSRQRGLGTVLESAQSAPISTYVHCMDLLRIFADAPTHAKPFEPYIRVPADTRIPDVLRNSDEFKVGLAWAGNPVHGRDALRSISFERLRPLLKVPGCRFFSLMVGERAGDISMCAPGERIHDISAGLADFLALAAVIAALDLVITIDSAACHLAGAMGKPVWTLLCTPPDWRWGLSGESTPLYPSMRLFRQPQPQDWDAVLTKVASELRHRVGREHSQE